MERGWGGHSDNGDGGSVNGGLDDGGSGGCGNSGNGFLIVFHQVK